MEYEDRKLNLKSLRERVDAFKSNPSNYEYSDENKLFSEEEAAILFDSNKITSNVNYLFFCMSDADKIKRLDFYDLKNDESIINLVKSSKDKVKVLCSIYDKTPNFTRIAYGNINILETLEEKDRFLSYMAGREGKISSIQFNRIATKIPYKQFEALFIKYVVKKKLVDRNILIFDNWFNGKIDYVLKLRKLELYYKYTDDKEDFLNFLDRNYTQEITMDIDTKGYEFPELTKAYAQKYNLNLKNLELVIKKFDYNILKYINIEKVQDIINMDKDKLEKLLSLFNEKSTTLDTDTINTIANAFLQKSFRINNKEIYNIFSRIEALLANPNISPREIRNILLGMQMNVEELGEIYSQMNFDKFIADLLKHDKDAIQKLHDITDEYIKKSREKYFDENINKFKANLNIVRIVDKQFFKKDFIKSKSLMTIIDEFMKIRDLTLEESTFIFTESFREIIQFKKNPENGISDEAKAKLKDFEILLNKVYELNKYKYRIKDIGIPYTYESQSVSKLEQLDILCEINADMVSKFLLDDEELFKSLSKELERFKFIGWGKTFNDVLDSCEIDYSTKTIGSLINNYYRIHKEKNANKLSTLIDYANVYDDRSTKYKYLLGEENYKYIYADPNENKTTANVNSRIEKCTQIMLEAYKQESVTVPPINKEYEGVFGNKIQITVGNKTNPINLCTGERTGSCLRAYGVFDDLFTFCNTNKNGFFMIFRDPLNDSFVSRVVGVRNGNTIYLNELRESKSFSIDNDDLYMALCDCLEEMIDIAQKNGDTIDNVVITTDFALKGFKNSEVPSGIKDIKKSLYGLNFNLESNGKCLVLCRKGKTLNYTFNENSHNYKPGRDRIEYTQDKAKALEKIHRIEMIDQMLEGKKFKDVILEENHDPVMTYSGEDWYAYQGTDGNTHVYIMKNTRNREEAIKEIESLNFERGNVYEV